MQSKTPVIWEDQVTNKFHVVNNTNGEKVPCNRFGLPLLPFAGSSGAAACRSGGALRFSLLVFCSSATTRPQRCTFRSGPFCSR